MMLPGMRYVANRGETLQHFRTVAKATAKPIMVYNNPVAYGVDVTPEMFAELQDQQNLVAIKESSDDIRRVTEIINLRGQRYQISCGVDDLALEAPCMGAVDWVAGLVGTYPKETIAIYQFYQQGQFEQAREIYRWFAPLRKLDVSNKLVQNIKLAESLAGYGREFVRSPRLSLAGREVEAVLDVIQKVNQSRPDLTQ